MTQNPLCGTYHHPGQFSMEIPGHFSAEIYSRCQNWSAPATYEMMRDVFYFRKDGMLFSRAAFPDEQVPA